MYNNLVIFITIFILQIKKQRLWNLSNVIESKSGRAVIQNQFCLLLELMLFFFFFNFKLYYFLKISAALGPHIGSSSCGARA